MIDVLPKFVFQNRCDAPLRIAPHFPNFPYADTPTDSEASKSDSLVSPLSMDTSALYSLGQSHSVAMASSQGKSDGESRLPGEMSFEKGRVARLTRWSCARAARARERRTSAKETAPDP